MGGINDRRFTGFKVSTKHSSGMVLTEYLIGTTFVAIALFAPIPAVGESAFEFLIGALRAYQANTTYLMSLP